MEAKDKDENMGNEGGDTFQAQKFKTITAKEVAAKISTKHEVYRFLTLDVNAYLPDYRTVTIWFLKDLISGAKKRK